MGSILFWIFLGIIWIIFFIIALVDDERTFGEVMFSGILIGLCIIMLSYHIDKYKTKKIFNSLRIGQEYVGSPKDNPFETDTIKILNCTVKDDKLWVQYKTTDGEVHASQIGNIIDYFK